MLLTTRPNFSDTDSAPPNRSARDLLPVAKGLLRKHVLHRTPKIPEQPHLSGGAAEKWRHEVDRANVMVEYGAGGSTVAAIGRVSLLVSVETDIRYLNAVERSVSSIAERGTFHPLHVNIGLTWDWGLPVVVNATPNRLARWRAYPAAPWRTLERLGAVPDLVFVDGRFRVACVLESLLRLPDGADCNFLMDDFVGRKDVYGPILQFVTDVGYHDDMISFRRKHGLDYEKCRTAIEKYYSDYR